jgi:hypothetical protein
VKTAGTIIKLINDILKHFSFLHKHNYYYTHKYILEYIECLFKFHFKVGVEESIVNAPRITGHESAVRI